MVYEHPNMSTHVKHNKNLKHHQHGNMYYWNLVFLQPNLVLGQGYPTASMLALPTCELARNMRGSVV